MLITRQTTRTNSLFTYATDNKPLGLLTTNGISPRRKTSIPLSTGLIMKFHIVHFRHHALIPKSFTNNKKMSYTFYVLYEHTPQKAYLRNGISGFLCLPYLHLQLSCSPEAFSFVSSKIRWPSHLSNNQINQVKYWVDSASIKSNSCTANNHFKYMFDCLHKYISIS